MHASINHSESAIGEDVDWARVSGMAHGRQSFDEEEARERAPEFPDVVSAVPQQTTNARLEEKLEKMPSQKTFKIKKILAKKQRQNRPIPQ